MRIGLLTCQSWEGIIEKEKALAAEINPQIEVDVLVWNDPNVAWTSYDYLIFRTIWDYFEHPIEFENWLNARIAEGLKSLNPLHVIKRNQHKFYLKELEEAGIEIIPTIFIPKNTPVDLTFLKDKNWEKAVIKPAVSGGSYLTRLFEMNELESVVEEYSEIVKERDLLVQPFIEEIQTVGETSILFFNGQFSHAVQKTPKKGDFRIQSQHGGHYELLNPDKELIEMAQNILLQFDKNLLYGRVDGIIKDGKFLLMEVELIEPDLYFEYFKDAKKNFLTALEDMVLGKN